jgi:nicotinate-nucleotide adenylyltransferase
MCGLLIEGDERLKILDIEKELKNPGHTLDLVVALRDGYPGYDFRLILGTDIYYEKERWRSWEELVRMAPPLYVDRKGVKPIPEPTLPAPPGIKSSELRAVLRRGQDTGNAIPKSVLDYILSRGLYKNAE